MDSKAKESHQFHGEFMHSVQVTQCVCNFVLVITCEGYTLQTLVTLSRILRVEDDFQQFMIWN